MDGSFGLTFGSPNAVRFEYEVEINPDLLIGEFASEVLPNLEESMANFLLPNLFPGTCALSPGDATASFRSGAVRRRLEVVGISSRPADEVSTTIECQDLLDPSNDCNYLDGELTLNYVERAGETIETFIRLALEGLRLGMDSDAFLDAHPSIVRVTFIDGPELADEPDGNEDPTTGNGDDDDDGSIAWWPWLLIGGVLFIACWGLLCCFGTRRFSPQSSRENDNTLLPGDSLPSTT